MAAIWRGSNPTNLRFDERYRNGDPAMTDYPKPPHPYRARKLDERQVGHADPRDAPKSPADPEVAPVPRLGDLDLENVPTPRTITRAYSSFEDARNVVVRLANAGIAPERMALLGHQAVGDDNTAIGAGVGGAAGAATGFIIGLGALTLPGVGPVIAAGWFLSGAVAGAFAGGAIGAFIDAGLSKDDAEAYADQHRRGASVVSVRVEEPDVETVISIMEAALPLGGGERHGETLDDTTQPNASVADDLSKVVS
jgi:hypothetical protein